eukprot:730752_1
MHKKKNKNKVMIKSRSYLFTLSTIYASCSFFKLSFASKSSHNNCLLFGYPLLVLVSLLLFHIRISIQLITQSTGYIAFLYLSFVYTPTCTHSAVNRHRIV